MRNRAAQSVESDPESTPNSGSGWQMARDAASCLAAFAHAIPLPHLDDSEADPDASSNVGAEVDGMDVGSNSGDGVNPLLGVAQVTEMGGLLLDALQRLKHTGAISAAQTGFQGLCVALLTPTEQGRLTHRDLRRLPARYDSSSRSPRCQRP